MELPPPAGSEDRVILRAGTVVSCVSCRKPAYQAEQDLRALSNTVADLRRVMKPLGGAGPLTQDINTGNGCSTDCPHCSTKWGVVLC